MTRIKSQSPVASAFVSPALNDLTSPSELIARVANIVPKVYPLEDYIAINPMQGLADRSFLDARSFLQAFSNCETLMPMGYFASRFQNGHFGVSSIKQAIEEWSSQQGGNCPSLETIIEQLDSTVADESIETVMGADESARTIETLARTAKHSTGRDWPAVVIDEVSRHCASHQDRSLATWADPFAELPMYEAWRHTCEIDRGAEIAGIKGFREFVAGLPESPQGAIKWLLDEADVPSDARESFLLCQAFSIPGWFSWANYCDGQSAIAAADESSTPEDPHTSVASMLAIRLAYDVALGRMLGLETQFEIQSDSLHQESVSQDAIVRMILLRASELAFQDGLLEEISGPLPTSSNRRSLAQMVFCIDVRSERFRRNLESVTSKVGTYGFAGFFAMPIEWVSLGDDHGQSHVPALIQPSFKLHEGISAEGSDDEHEIASDRFAIRRGRKLWKRLQKSSTACFPFVESMGLLYAWKMARATLGNPPVSDPSGDGLGDHGVTSLGPTMRGLNSQGVTTNKQIDLAESMLRGIGIIDHFARLVVFCGHASKTANNPLAAGLDCGACCGHSGEPNARFAALLLNQPYIRQGLAERGIEIPDDTRFLGGLHNTTTDEVSFFADDYPMPNHQDDLAELIESTAVASGRTRTERLPTLDAQTIADPMRRSSDWSEVRPEWGLAGNAAFIVAPRERTMNADLGGESFLHSYDYTNDPESAVLEVIMTAPMVVANWINLQYYASSVDQRHFGSGSKTVHNVVGHFGVLSGNGGDMMTGLPSQSVHDGEKFMHAPRRLLAVIEAPRDRIASVIDRHESLQNLIGNGWMHLVAIDDGKHYRYAANGSWLAF